MAQMLPQITDSVKKRGRPGTPARRAIEFCI
jgi:hypothetical protein